MAPSLKVENLSKSFSLGQESLGVLESISFSVSPGMIVGVLGASGCGKSTLLKILAGLDRCYGGTVQSNIVRPGPQVGFQQQGERLIPWRDLLSNVELGLDLLYGKQSQHQERARESINLVGLASFERSYPHELSGGMVQRVLVARLLAINPALLLLDEPLSQLDILSRRSLAGIIRSYVKNAGAAAVLVTHSVEEAITACDVIVTLSRRPARIVHRFALSQEYGAGDIKLVNQETAFEEIQNSLLGALS